MQVNARTAARVLVVADWTVDPRDVVAACAERGDEAVFVLTVPAWLHGLDWAGDPAASAPCAQRQLDAIASLSRASGLDLEVAGVGDPDPMSAIGDTLDAHGATEILLVARRRRIAGSHPWDLVNRAQRLTGLPVRRVAASPAPGLGRRGWAVLRGGGRCDPHVRQAA
jgi:hypothetical protein